MHQPHARANPDREYVGYSYQIIATIVQRSDNAILRAIHERLGGELKLRKNFYVVVKDDSHRRTATWRTAKYAECERVGRLLQGGTSLPFRKGDQVVLWQEANLIRATKKRGRGTPYTIAEAKRMREISDELKRLKDYDGVTVSPTSSSPILSKKPASIPISLRQVKSLESRLDQQSTFSFATL